LGILTASTAYTHTALHTYRAYKTERKKPTANTIQFICGSCRC